MVIFHDDADRSKFLETFTIVVQERRLLCHADCEMRNHYHLVVTTLESNISAAIQQLNGDYAQWWNKRHGHVGHVFQGRFNAQIIQDETYLLTACRYVVLNPVRAGLVEDAGQWRWSSYRATAGIVPVPAYLSPETLWRYTGGNGKAPTRYREFIEESVRDEMLPRESVLGDDQFRQQFAEWRERASREVPTRERTSPPPLDDLFVLAVSRAARNAAILEALAAGYQATEIADYLGLHPRTVSRLPLGNGGGGCQIDKTSRSQT
jgi:putative transposase